MRRPALDPGWYKDRNGVGRCISTLGQHCAVATRYDTRQSMYEGSAGVASIHV